MMKCEQCGSEWFTQEKMFHPGPQVVAPNMMFGQVGDAYWILRCARCNHIHHAENVNRIVDTSLLISTDEAQSLEFMRGAR